MVFEYNSSQIKNRDRKQYLGIISMVKECDDAIKSLNREDEDYTECRRREFEKCLRKLRRKTIKENTMYSLIAYAFVTGGSICDRLLTVLYDLEPENFLKCFKNKQKVPRKIVEIA